MTSKARPRPPAGLGSAGKALWRRVTGAYELTEVELAILELAARQSDDLAALEAVLADGGLIVAGSMGQERVSAVVTECRLGRAALAKLIRQIDLPTDDDEAERGPAEASLASRAAGARWDRKRRHGAHLNAVPDGSAS